MDDASKVVCDAAGNIIVVGSTDDRITGRDMLTIKYSGNDGAVIWQQRYNGPANTEDVAVAAAVDGSGNVVITGYSYDTHGYWDYYTAKYAAPDGTLIWEHRYSTPGFGDDRATAVAVDAGGNAVVTGYSATANGYGDYYTAKYGAGNGTLLWEQRYNGPANGLDQAQAVAVDHSGNVVVTGYSYNTNGNIVDYCTIKYAAADGRLMWEKHGSGGGQAVAVDGSDNVVVTGFYRMPVVPPYIGFPNYTTRDYTAKYAAADGTLLWSQQYGSIDSVDYASALALDANGNVIVTGTSFRSYEESYDYYTVKYAASNGALLWERRYDGPTGDRNMDSDEAVAVSIDGSGNVIVTGFSNDTGDFYDNDYYTAKYAAADGALLWERRYAGASDDTARSVALDPGGNVIVTGYVTGYSGDNEFSRDSYTAKYAAINGAVLWEKRYNGLANNDDGATAVAVDGAGNVVVSGRSLAGNGSGNFYTAKYGMTNGVLLWEKRSQGGGGAIAVDASGNVVITGIYWNGNYDYYTAKFAAASGVMVWERRYNGPANGNDQLYTVAVDSSGNVVVTGTSWNGTNSDYYTAKYASANGTLLWEQRYNGPANSDDSGTAVTVDITGNVVVTGSSRNGSNTDYYTAKYAAGNGALIWEKRYNGPANRDDTAYAVAVDRSGNAVVTGSSGNGNNDDYYTASYAAADGALVWEQRYNGPANNTDVATAVATDSSGNAVVTGYSAKISGNNDIYTAKYSSTDGTLVWEKRYDNSGEDTGRAIAVDSSGNVVVTGPSWSQMNYDYYTAKYAASDGVLLWEKRYNGHANGIDSPTSLALGPNGMVAVAGYSDGDFAPTATYDFATILYREPLKPVFITRVSAGIVLRFSVDPGSTIAIQRATSVTGPWNTLANPTAPPNGLVEHLDANPPPGTAYYRTRTP